VCVHTPNSHFDLDTLESVPGWNQGAADKPQIGLSFEVASRQGVDGLYTEPIAAGHRPQQPPYDAPWGRRLARGPRREPNRTDERPLT
jgi:hypothetical protein